MRGADGSMFFIERATDMKVGGENVAAIEIERVIPGVAGVAEAAAVGWPTPCSTRRPSPS
jgi:crotonobetaine/carnitine-CoA ligase